MTATPAAPRRGQPRLLALLSILFGLAACWFPLALSDADPGYRGWVITTAGITAVGFAITASRIRSSHGYSTGVLPALGWTLGAIGTVLCLWSAAAFYWPESVPSLPQLPSPANESPAAFPPDPLLAPVASPTAAPPVVEPIAGAAITAPDEQLLANVRHVARNLCTGVAASKQMGMQYGSGFGGVPLSLTVGADGTVSGGTATYSQLPIDMALEYFGTPEGDYSLTVRDIVSGLGVGCDSFSDNLVTR